MEQLAIRNFIASGNKQSRRGSTTQHRAPGKTQKKLDSSFLPFPLFILWVQLHLLLFFYISVFTRLFVASSVLWHLISIKKMMIKHFFEMDSEIFWILKIQEAQYVAQSLIYRKHPPVPWCSGSTSSTSRDCMAWCLPLPSGRSERTCPSTIELHCKDDPVMG